MFYRGIIFDLDSTLFDYHICHDKSLDACIEYLSRHTTFSKDYIKEKYNKISKELKWELPSSAPSCNKAIYFKQMTEVLDIGYGHFTNLHELYWNTYYEIIPTTIYDGVVEFLEWNKSMFQTKFAILSNYKIDFQMKKMEKLGILKYFDSIVTSEEVGIEKPSRKIFLNVLDKLDLRSHEVIMIGDDYTKDIRGAINVGIYSYWFTQKDDSTQNINPLCRTFSSYKDLFIEFNEYYEELKNFIELSRFYGERFDLIQGNKGSISIKYGYNKMLITKDGSNILDTNETQGYSIVRYEDIKKNIKSNEISKNDLYKFSLTKNIPSIDTCIHSVLKKYTVFSNPIIYQKISNQGFEKLQELFPNELCIENYTNNIDLSKYIQNKIPNIIFIKNCGMILTSDDYNDIYRLLISFESMFQINENYKKYKYANEISKYIHKSHKKNIVTYLSTNQELYRFLYEIPSSFENSNNMIPLFMNDINDITSYFNMYNDIPKIIVYNMHIYITGINSEIIKETEDSFLVNLIIL